MTPVKLKDLEGEIELLEAKNALLNSKLKEALAAQPWNLDPRELERAQARALSLEKERDLLKVALEQSANPTLSGDPNVTLQEQVILAQVRKELSDQKQITQ